MYFSLILCEFGLLNTFFFALGLWSIFFCRQLVHVEKYRQQHGIINNIICIFFLININEQKVLILDKTKH